MSSSHINLANDFAEKWAHRNRHKYRSEQDRRLAIVEVDISVERDDILYLDQPEHHLDLRLLLANCIKYEFGVSSPFDVEREKVMQIEPVLCGIIEHYIQRVEAKLGRGIKVVFKAQVPPVQDPMRELIGLSSCFSVRDTGCITNMSISVI